MPANKLGNGIEGNASSDLPVLNYLYNELKDSLHTKFGNLDNLQQGQLVTFIHSLLQTINLKLNYFEKRNSSSDALLKKIFSNVVSDCRADMLILRAVEAYLNLSMDVDNPPPALENPDDLSTRFRHTLPDSPITKIIENLVDSAKSEKVEDTAFKDAIIDNEDSHQHNEFDDGEHEFDLNHPPLDSIIANKPEPYDQDEHEDQQDPPNYPEKEMHYDEAVDYLKNIGYLSNAKSLPTSAGDLLWTIGDDYASMDGTSDNLTLQKHIENYNIRLQSREITYNGNKELKVITLI